jgi:hypothetical protein
MNVQMDMSNISHDRNQFKLIPSAYSNYVDAFNAATQVAAEVTYNTTYAMQAYTATSGGTAGLLSLLANSLPQINPNTKSFLPLAQFKLLPSVSSQTNQPVHYGDHFYFQWVVPSGGISVSKASSRYTCGCEFYSLTSGGKGSLMQLQNVNAPSSTLAVRQGDRFNIMVAGGAVLKINQSNSLVDSTSMFVGSGAAGASGSTKCIYGSFAPRLCAWKSYYYSAVGTDGKISYGCTSNSQCQGGFQCVSGKCTDLPPPPPPPGPGSDPDDGDGGSVPETQFTKTFRILLFIFGGLMLVLLIGHFMSSSKPRTIIKYEPRPQMAPTPQMTSTSV